LYVRGFLGKIAAVLRPGDSMPSTLRQRLVIGNWKMHGSADSVSELLQKLIPLCEGASAQIAVCPSSVYLPLAVELTAGSNVAVGGQDCSASEAGAHTGEIAAAMLVDIGCDLVIVGHSERRQGWGESSELVAAKCAAAKQAGLVPIICVGESLQQREQGDAETVVAEQLQAVLPGLVATDVIAYEPVWAIGTGKTATAEQAQQMHGFIRGVLRGSLGEAAEQIRLLYGGSVKAANAEELFSQADIDGGLVGGAALDAQEFAAIVSAAG
jgi:triosephosphate isomerase